jgi:hypothetical protein
MINIHNSSVVIPEVHPSDDGRGWLTLKVKRKNYYNDSQMEDVEVTMFTEDIETFVKDLSEALREGISHLNDELAEKELAV